MNLWAVFATGLTVGGLTCLAVQGGLLASTIAQRKEERLKEEIESSPRLSHFVRRRAPSLRSSAPILSFLGAKLVAYTILGFLLGWFGSFFQLSLTASVILQFAAGIFMIGTALNLLNIHPIFRYFVIQPPRLLTRLVRKQSKSKDMFAPALLGAFTVLIPCGTTQAMMVLAIASGNPLLGASILFAFTLGTSPVFFILGYLATRLGDALHQKFMKIAAYAIILLAIFNLNNTFALSGSSFTLDRIWRSAYCTVYFCDDSSIFAQNSNVLGQAISEATINIEQAGYSPNNLVIKAGSTVTLNLVNNGGGGCTQSFTIPRLGIQKVVPLGQSDTIQFTAPSEPQELAFMCGMGMFRGVINVI